MNFTTGDVATLSDQQLINNIALLKQNKVDLSNFPGISTEKLISMHINVLKLRHYDDDDIDIKVTDAMGESGDINGGKFWTTTDKIVGTAGDIADVIGNFRRFFTKGGTYDDDTDGSTYDVKPKQDENFNFMPYIIGGGLFIAVTIGALLILSKKNDK